MVDKTSETGMGSWQPAQGVGNWGVSKAAPEGQGGAPGQRPIRLKNGVPQVDPYPDSSNDGFIPIPPEAITDADEIMTSEPLPQLDTIRPADMRTLLIRDPRVGNNQSILGFYDPVRDVTPATKGAPAPDTQGVVGDPWVDLGDNGREYPINLNDPAIRKLLQHLQATFPEIGFFPGATDINKIGKDELPSIREPGDLDKHLIINHAVEVDTTVYPIEMIDELHIQMHDEGQASDHNPEVLKVANILDPIQETLDPKIWDNPTDEKPRLKPSINAWIKQTIFGTLKNNGYKTPEDWIKLIITGSLTTYQWSETSDLDVSIWVDLAQFSDFNRSEMIKIMINELDGSLVPGTNHPIQCFVVDVKSIKSPSEIYKVDVRSAYELDNNEWLVKPERERSKHVPSQFPDFFRKARQASAKMKLLLQYDKGSAKAYWHFLHKRRREDMKAGFGDYSESNIVYKMLANDGLFDEISEVTGEHIANQSIFSTLINQRKHLVGITKDSDNLFFATCMTCLWKGPQRFSLTPANDDRKFHIKDLLDQNIEN